MAKFCGNCGAKMDDSAVVCGQCGTKFPPESVKAAPPSAPTSYTPPKAPKKIPGVGGTGKSVDKKKIKATVKKVFAAVIVIALVSIAIKVTVSFTGWRGTLRKTINAYEDFDMNTLCEVASDMSYAYYNSSASDSYYGGTFSTSVEDQFENVVENNLERLEELVGHDPKISYEIVDSYKLDGRNLKNLFEQAEQSGADTSNISKVMEVELKITAKGSKTKDTHTSVLYLVKQSDGWRVDYPNRYD